MHRLASRILVLGEVIAAENADWLLWFTQTKGEQYDISEEDLHAVEVRLAATAQAFAREALTALLEERRGDAWIAQALAGVDDRRLMPY